MRRLGPQAGGRGALADCQRVAHLAGKVDLAFQVLAADDEQGALSLAVGELAPTFDMGVRVRRHG